MASIALHFFSIRENRAFFFALAVAMALIHVAAFGVQQMLGRSSFSAPLVFHLRAIVFFGWVGFFVFQAWLASRGAMSQHQRVGWMGVGWAALMVVIGIVTTIHVVRAGRVPFFFVPGYFLVTNIIMIGGFAGLLWWGVALRRRTDWHRRIIMCAMIAIMGPAFGRLLPAPLMIPWSAWGIFAGTMIFSLVGMLHDRWRHGRVHPAWLVGIAVLLAMQVAMDAIALGPVGPALYPIVTAGSPGAAIAPFAYPPMPPMP